MSLTYAKIINEQDPRISREQVSLGDNRNRLFCRSEAMRSRGLCRSIEKLIDKAHAGNPAK